MAYDITHFEQGNIKGLKIPKDFFKPSVMPSDQRKVFPFRDDRFKLVVGDWCNQLEIIAEPHGLDYLVHSIDIYGVGSGHAFWENLMPFFEASKGYYDAVVVWEGGDRIVKLTVNDGAVDETPINVWSIVGKKLDRKGSE